MGYQVKIKTEWISMEDLIPPKDWVLPFTTQHEGRKYTITGADYVSRTWRAEEDRDGTNL